ncbi:MAG: PilZ domain-containing protein [Candidatus Aminicenantes bacterium]|nr:PilZ domain-containing protein [Candidatus Aminicenantes bacterium]
MEDITRKGARVAVVAEISYEHKGVTFNDRITDLSAVGFYIDTLHPLPENSRISFTLVLPGDGDGTPVSGEGEVAWIQKMQGMGVRITRMPDEDRTHLENFLSRFRGSR